MSRLTEDHFDDYVCKDTGETISIKVFTFENSNDLSVQVINFGATIVSVKCPDKNGVVRDVVAGFTNMDGYLSEENPHFGATIGRVANYVTNASFKCLNKTVLLSKNAGEHHLNGGFVGFDKVVWIPHIQGQKLVLSYMSPDLEEGYSGDLLVHAFFELTESNKFIIQYKAHATEPTYVNITNHTFFNLGGYYSGPCSTYQHVVTINSNQVVKRNAEGIPTGELKNVELTPYDFQIPIQLGRVINKIPDCDGIDHNYCMVPDKGCCYNASLRHPENGRVLDIFSNQATVHFYTGNSLPEHRKTFKGDASELKVLTGKCCNFYKHGAVCLAPENFPDAPNQDFPGKSVLYPGDFYYNCITYAFSVKSE